MTRGEARLERIFRRLLLVSATASPLACGSSGAPAKDGGAKPTDANVAAVTLVDSSQPDDVNAPDTSTTDEDATLADASVPDSTVPSDDSGYGYSDAACNPTLIDAFLCTTYQALPCGLPPDTPVENCYLLISQCQVLCAEKIAEPCGILECLSTDAGIMPDATAYTLECATGHLGCSPGVGRRPAGLASAAPRRTRREESAVGGLLADIAHLEAASVFAFRRLRDELSCMRAPKRLVRAAERSARDEVRHARVTARLARRRGALPAKVVAPACPTRSLEDFATENAVEGCVRECFGALVATRQASLAEDPEIRREMCAIAKDETRHAALAWDVARWSHARLDGAARERVRQAMHDAVRSLRDEVARTPREVARELGLPTGAEARALVDGFAAALLS